METFTETKLINLNSKDAIQNNSTYLSSVYFQIKGLLKNDDDIIERYIGVQNAQIPFSFYNINIYNNILKLQIGLTVSTLTLTRGNYNATTLIQEIKTQLTNNSITDISIAISSITGLLTFTKASGSFTLLSNGSTIFGILGFVVGSDYTSVDQILTAPYPLNLLGTLRLRICSYTIATSNIDFTLMSIPIEVGNFGLIQYTNASNIRSVLNNDTLDGFDIQIIDDDDNLINFNNINWTMTFELSLVRRKQSISELNFNQIITNQTTKIPIENNNQNEDEEAQQEPIVENPITEPETEDLDLLLYNNHGVIN